MWNPPLDRRGAGDSPLGARRGSGAARAARARRGALYLLHEVAQGRRDARRLVKQDLADSAPELADLIAPYRAGYTPQQRRELEGRLTRGELRAVITTDALELGIDIGELDAAVVVTFPGTVASLRQMWGRAGRRGRGLAAYVAGEDALDQFFCRHPDEFLERPVEAAILDHESELIYRGHLLCAAHEGPLCSADAEFLGPRWEAHAEVLLSAGAAAPPRRPAGRRPTSPARPAAIPRRRCRCARPRRRPSRSWTCPRARCLAPPRPRAPTPPSMRARSTCTWGARYEVRELDLERRRALGSAVRRRLVHPAQAQHRHGDRAPARPSPRRSA